LRRFAPQKRRPKNDRTRITKRENKTPSEEAGTS
jgi:hypothetical protein